MLVKKVLSRRARWDCRRLTAGASSDESGVTDLRNVSDAVLCRLAGFTLEKLMERNTGDGTMC
jgi:hypothetical protein